MTLFLALAGFYGSKISTVLVFLGATPDQEVELSRGLLEFLKEYESKEPELVRRGKRG